MCYKYLLILIFMLFNSYLFGQPSAQIEIDIDPEYGLYIVHSIQKGQTIYGLSHHFGGDVSKTIDLNPDIDLINISINTPVKFYLSQETINSVFLDEMSVQGVYTVKQGETMYSISKKYFNQDIKQLLKLNNKSSTALNQSEQLIVGYVSLPYYDKSIQTLVSLDANDFIGPIVPTQDSTDALVTITYDSIAVTETWVKEKGLAYWQTSEHETDELLVMHSKAKINSEILLYNPMLDRQVNATVIGQLPDNSYPDNISIVISPAVADALGALDKRFLVEMTYIQ